MKLLTKSDKLISGLKKIEIEDSISLVNYLPYRYEEFFYDDETSFYDKKRVVIKGKLNASPRLVKTSSVDITIFYFRSIKGNLYVVKAFNHRYLKNILNTNDEYSLVGQYNEGRKEITFSSIKKGDFEEKDRFKAVYHIPQTISPSSYSSLLKRTLQSYKGLFVDIVPSFIKNKYHLMNHEEALNKIHFPLSEKDIIYSKRTLKYEECLEYCLKNRIIREANKKSVKKESIEISSYRINDFIFNLPYSLTSDQEEVIREIIRDMKSKALMYRLLQGDVGTGKTLVAIIALYANSLRNKQGVLMVPTDSLARQHFENAKLLLEPYNIKVGLLVGSLSLKEKKSIKEKIKNKELDVLVGTHALFSKDVIYDNLGLAIIDEQHRFGVNQRNFLASKGDEVDLLLMSATPIPRTLALSLYGDLDVSSLSSFPGKRREVSTIVCEEDSPKIVGLIEFCLMNNKQVFIVCPKIESTLKKTKSVEEIYEKYKDKYKDKIAYLHGKMGNNEKIEILARFKDGTCPILISTTVIELGIDIKNALGIIIFSASSFGLASLHQLRGRVGRDGQKAYCLLVDNFEDEQEKEKLKFLETCSDGYEISQKDMEMRGPGDFIGVKQSGFPTFSCLNIVSDFKMFECARDDSLYICSHLDDNECFRYYDYVLERMKKDEESIPLFD